MCDVPVRHVAHFHHHPMKPIQIDVFYPVPEGWGLCTTCEMMLAQANLGDDPQHRNLDEYPPEWQEEFKRLSSIIIDLASRYQDKVYIRIWDPRSLQGLWYSIRFGVHKYPTFIIDKHYKQAGWDIQSIDQYIQSNIESPESNI
jgi:hypothetical protein